jgi:acyl dehydratase
VSTVQVGTVLPTRAVAGVDPARMKTMAALLRDPNPIHYDILAVKAAGMGDRVVNQGPSNLGYIVNLLLEWAGDPAAIRSVRSRFVGNVFAGDHVTAGGEVTAVEPLDDAQQVTCAVWLDRDDGARLVTGEALLIIPA